MNLAELKSNYLTEDILEQYLSLLFPNIEIIRDKSVPNSNSRFRPDFRIESLKLMIEFDGSAHFTNANVIINDSIKTSLYTDMGYKIIRIPYFIQLTSQVIGFLFKDYSYNKEIISSISSEYPHGFIDKKAELPANYCFLGIKNYEKILRMFSPLGLRTHIDVSLVRKIVEYKSLLKVIPYIELLENDHQQHIKNQY